jgi:HD-like signal output (HDOD) protein
MDRAALEKIATLVKDLPALPAVAQEALGLLSNPKTEPEELQAVLSRDPGLSLKILRLANSAYYRRNREISTLTSAILLLGFKTIQTLILSSAVHRVLTSGGSAATSLWEHSLAAALACRELGRRLRGFCSDAEEAFLAGLFHDTAKGVIGAKFPGIYSVPLGLDGEIESLGFHHGHLGQVLLSKWDIPPALCLAVGSHHEREPQGLGLLTAIADWLAWGLAPGIGAEAPEEPSRLLSAVGIDKDLLEEIQRSLAATLAEERGSHG